MEPSTTTSPPLPTPPDEVPATGARELTTGWEPDLPVEDTLVRTATFHNADLSAAVGRAAGGRVLERPDVLAVDLRRPAGYWNAAILLRPPADLGPLLDELEGFYRGGRGEVALWSAWPTPDLRTRGWALSGHPPLLARPPSSLAPVPDVEDPPVHAVDDPQVLARWERVAAAAYPLEGVADEPPGTLAPPALLEDDRVGYWVAPDPQDPGAVAMAFRSRGVGSLAFGATTPDRRHSGLWQALAAERLGWIGDAWAIGVFSDLSRPGAQRLGFVPITRLTLWVLERS